MGWYKNQKARHDAKRAGQPRPRTGGLGDKLADKLEEKVAASKDREEAMRAHQAEHGSSARSYLLYRKTRRNDESRPHH